MGRAGAASLDQATGVSSVQSTTAPPVLPNQYLVYTDYVGPDQPGILATWVLPPAAVYNGATPAQPLQIPFLYTGTGDPSKLKVPNDDFLIAATWSGTPIPANVVVTLQLTGKNAWNTGPAARAALRQNFLQFLATIEGSFELGTPPLLIAGATSILAAALVQYMPLPIAETLRYACGLESGIGTGAPPSVDVLPGMRLRSEPSSRQYVAPPSQAFSGWMATGTLGWDVATSVASGARVQAFDAFFGAVAGPQITPPPESPAPVYSLVDLQLSNTGYKYHRLVYPQNIVAGSAPGSLSAQMNVQLVGANTLMELRSSAPFSTIFYGRDVVIPEICVWLGLSGAALQPIYVPLGTTVNNMLERFTRWKPLSTSDAHNVVRLTRPAYSSQQLGSLVGLGVTFVPTSKSITNLSALDLPLWPGDGLLLGFPVGT
jgi:hypothetical protein